jgi:hypothetical protein
MSKYYKFSLFRGHIIIMTDLKDIKRPGIALIKLVEATGILLGAESRQVSYFKVPTPSRYDATIEQLSQNYNDVINNLVNIKINGISNDQAHDLYEKMLEPGFDYDEAINNGGSRCRELFDLVFYLLSQIQEDSERYPVQSNNVYFLMDGSRVSYLAFDVATHIFNHGVCFAGVVDIVNEDGISENPGFANSLCLDLDRRFYSHFKLERHRCDVKLLQSTEETIMETTKSSITQRNTSIVVLGINERDMFQSRQQAMMKWALWNTDLTVVVVKAQASPRPFDVVITPKTYLIYLNENTNVVDYLTRASICMRATDSFVVLMIVDDSAPVGDLQDTRFGLGGRSGWVDSIENPSKKLVQGWNQPAIDSMKSEVEKFISWSRIEGKLRIEVKSKYRPVSQDICKYATQEAAEVIVLGREHVPRDMVMECIRSNELSTIAVIK